MTAALARTVVLDAVSWRARRQAHERRVDQWLAPHLRRRTGVRHPVEDFLFRKVKIANNLPDLGPTCNKRSPGTLLSGQNPRHQSDRNEA